MFQILSCLSSVLKQNSSIRCLYSLSIFSVLSHFLTIPIRLLPLPLLKCYSTKSSVAVVAINLTHMFSYSFFHFSSLYYSNLEHIFSLSFSSSPPSSLLISYSIIKCWKSSKLTARFSFSSVQLLSRVQLLATPWTAVCKASLPIKNSQSLLKLKSTESVMPSNHLILCHPLFLPPSIFPSIRVFSNALVLCIR